MRGETPDVLVAGVSHEGRRDGLLLGVTREQEQAQRKERGAPAQGAQ
ncbi:hypothetical protein HUA74_34930 [Myxococcus sp. CA051A]|nr:hypothetical protein [Myxococcus sp. CA051A]NTX65867.1 hypothetical protein [Myxococcus sp. CA051A]